MIYQFIRINGVSNMEVARREQSDGAEFPFYPWIKVCPYCYVVWAVADSWTEWPIHHSVHGVSCEYCNRPNYHSPVPGSILDDQARLATDWDLLHDLPFDLLVREFLLHLKAHDEYLARSAAVQLHYNDPLLSSSESLGDSG